MTGTPGSGSFMVSVDRVVAADPIAVWRLLVDIEAWPKWGPSIRRAELTQPHQRIGLNATGVVHTSVGIAAPFEITAFDAGRYWAWRVAGLPATSHRVDAYADGSRITFSVPWWAAGYVAMCALALHRIDAILTG